MLRHLSPIDFKKSTKPQDNSLDLQKMYTAVEMEILKFQTLSKATFKK